MYIENFVIMNSHSDWFSGRGEGREEEGKRSKKRRSRRKRKRREEGGGGKIGDTDTEIKESKEEWKMSRGPGEG